MFRTTAFPMTQLEITDDINKVPTKRADFNGAMSETSSHKTYCSLMLKKVTVV